MKEAVERVMKAFAQKHKQMTPEQERKGCRRGVGRN